MQDYFNDQQQEAGYDNKPMSRVREALIYCQELELFSKPST